MKAIMRFTIVLVLVGIFMAPTSTYASSYTAQTETKSSFFSLDYIFSIFNIDYKNESSHDYGSDKNGYNDKNNYYEKNGDSLWDSFCKWWFGSGSGGHDGGGTGECRDNKGSWSNWGNDNGCLDSAEIWKKWYCR